MRYVSWEDMRHELAAYVAHFKTAQVARNLLATYGVQKVSQLWPEDYADFYGDLQMRSTERTQYAYRV